MSMSSLPINPCAHACLQVQWNACVSAAAFFSNARLVAHPRAAQRAPQLLLLLLMLLRDSGNFKIRTHAGGTLGVGVWGPGGALAGAAAAAARSGRSGRSKIRTRTEAQLLIYMHNFKYTVGLQMILRSKCFTGEATSFQGFLK
jgi:hypothetical protein